MWVISQHPELVISQKTKNIYHFFNFILTSPTFSCPLSLIRKTNSLWSCQKGCSLYMGQCHSDQILHTLELLGNPFSLHHSYLQYSHVYDQRCRKHLKPAQIFNTDHWNQVWFCQIMHVTSYSNRLQSTGYDAEIV